jgi:CHAT domain-containing protein
MKKQQKAIGLALSLLLLLLLLGCWFLYPAVIRPDATKEKSVSNPAKPDALAQRPPVVEPPFRHPYLSKPDSLHKADNFDSARYYYQKAALLLKAEKNWKGYVWALNRVGNAGIRSDHPEAAYQALQEALRTGLRELGPNHRYVGNTYYYLGEYYYTTKEFQQALTAHQQALKIRYSLFGRRNSIVADSYLQMAQVYRYLLFDYARAEAYLDTVLVIVEQSTEKNLDKAASLYYDLAAINRLKGDLDKALLYANQYLVTAQALKEDRYLELAHSTLGGIYYTRSDFASSILHVQRAIALHKENSKKNNQPHNLAYYYNELGNAYGQTRQFKRAITFFNKALAVFASSETPDSLAISNSYAYLGDIYRQVSNLDSSRYHFQQCLQIRLAHFGKKHFKTSLAYQNLGSLYQQRGQADQALMYFQQALVAGVPDFHLTRLEANPTLALIGSRYYLYETIGLKARALKQRYLAQSRNQSDLMQALACYQLADTLMQLYARSYDLENSKLALAQNSQHIYEEALDCTFLLSRAGKTKDYHTYAFHFLERSKSQLLLQGLRQAEELHATGVPDSLVNLGKSLRFKMANYQQELETALHQEKQNEGRLQQIRTRMLDLTVEQEKLEQVLENKFPTLFTYKNADQVIPLPQVQRNIKGTSKRVLAYFWGDSSIYLLGITEKDSKLIQIPRTRKFNQTFTAFIQSFSNAAAGPADNIAQEQEAFKLYSKRAYYLYKTLLGPVLPFAPGPANNLTATPRQELIFIPDGPLAYLPFNVLITDLPLSEAIDYKKLSYLLYHFQSSYCYSATLLDRQFRRKVKTATPAVLAFGYSDTEQEVSWASNSNQRQELWGAGRELTAIADLMQGRFLKGKEATESSFKRYAPAYDILHLALHGSANKENQYESHLIFKPSAHQAEDGLLYAHELYGLKLQARLVVLSACETGMGKLYTGEGVYSIARGFAYAGCPSLVMSLWQVDDHTTADLMQHFYQGLAGGLPIHESLQQAQRQYLQAEDELSAHPRYWAALIPVGDMTPLQPAYATLFWVLAGVIATVGLFFLIRLKK